VVGAVAAVAVVLVLAQILGPAIAAKVVEAKLGKYGTVKSVTVKAWPAIKLAWREADEVRVDADALTISPQQTVPLLKEAAGVERMHAAAQSVDEGGLRLTDARFEKHGSALRAEGVVSEADIARVLPAGMTVALLGSEAGKVRVRVSGGLFGLNASVEAVAMAEDGKLVARPDGLFGGLRMTIFASPSIAVEGISARALGEGPEGRRYELTMWAKLR
jgi:LmeA-like phospholipid-binding